MRHQLEIQSMQIEEVFTRHEVPAEVQGGMVHSRWVSFDLQASLAAGLERLRTLKDDLKATLGAPDVRIENQDGRLRVVVRQPQPHPVDLLDLVEALGSPYPLTAALGLAEDGRPVLLNLLAPEVTHVLIAGNVAAGKSGLLRTFALSLALQNKQSQVQLVVIEGSQPAAPGQRSELVSLVYLPHMLLPVMDQVEEVAEALAFLEREVQYRKEQAITRPLLVVLVDDLYELVEAGGAPVAEPLARLLGEGAAAGVRLVMATDLLAGDSPPDLLRSLLRHHFAIRLVGQTPDAETARAMAGIPDSRAEYLLGRGDFVAVSGDAVVPFQAAYLGDSDLHLTVERLHRQQQPVMLAQPVQMRPSLTLADAPEEPQLFRLSRSGAASLEPPAGEDEWESDGSAWHGAEPF
ncbi:MAG: DNA translocase FtsK [Chloroflexi bacterium]|nr:DNA translocase FtsK [Chloroflexota bacterium]MCI0578553.1 DNA translocase FtsK [Chloroflexota bacterium]MCI0648327.1 DNA translocase FtsK [Chloroflexota bacterium]MCI0729566.1 DNA translocase FtsK [Chloroflexota bacterium]